LGDDEENSIVDFQIVCETCIALEKVGLPDKVTCFCMIFLIFIMFQKSYFKARDEESLKKEQFRMPKDHKLFSRLSNILIGGIIQISLLNVSFSLYNKIIYSLQFHISKTFTICTF